MERSVMANKTKSPAKSPADGAVKEAAKEIEATEKASEEKAAKDPIREHQVAKVAELGKDASNTIHPGERPLAPPTEHGEKSGLKHLVDDLHGRRDKIRLGGGPEKVADQHGKGKLTARERIDLLVDKGTFVELGAHGRPHFSQRSMEGREAPADGVVTGWGDVEGRRCAIVAYDFTVMAGSMGMTGELKVSRLRELALTKRLPFIWLLDSAGARIQEAVGSLFAGSGHLFREEVTMSGCIPLVAALMGPCAAGTAYIPGLADFVPMVSGQGSMALAGPYLVKAVTGEDVTQEELGGAKIHCRKSGVGDLEVADDGECIESIKKYLSYFPSNCAQAPPIRECKDPVDRMDEELLDVVPESPRHPYNMYDLIERIVDDGEYFDLKPKWAKTIITCFARFGGRPVGIVANQPKQLAGILENDSADKAARFINLCDAFNIPLVFLQDVPGFMVGTKVEQEGIIRHGAKMLYAVSRATVPKVTVVVRKAYGAGYYVMCGKAYEPDLIVAWPSAEISVMGAEGAVNIIFRKQIDASDDPEKARAELVNNFKQIIDPYIAAGNAMVDDIIDPRETRPTIIRGLEMAANKKIDRPWKKHGVMPV
jgi:acetyl-CoA carboxylase carboxyltransferase component